MLTSTFKFLTRYFLTTVDSFFELCYNRSMGGEIEKLQEILKKDPSNFQARRELSVMLADNGFNEEALFNLKYLKKYFPEDAEIHYNIGIIYEKLKDFTSAEKAYKKAAALSPQADFYYNLGEVLVNLNKWDEGIDAFKKVLDTDPGDGNCYFNLGVCYYNKDELNKAENNFKKAIEINPDDLYAHFYLGNLYQKQGLTNFAEECYKKVLGISPDYSWAYFNLASIAYQNGNIDEAKSNLLLAIEYNKQDIEAYKLLTKISIKYDDVENILTILHSRIEEEENGDLCYILAQVYKYIGNAESCVKYIRLALKNHLTLSYPVDKVKLELENIEESEGIEPPDEIEEYDSEDEEDDDEDYIEDEESEAEDLDEDDGEDSDEDDETAEEEDI